MKSFRQYLLEYSLGPNHPDFGKPENPTPYDGPDDEIKATIRNKNGVHLASSDHPDPDDPTSPGLTGKSANMDGTYMFGISYGKTLLHEVVMKDGQVGHIHQINPATGEHFIPESDTDRVESLVVRHLSAHVHDSDGNPTGRSVHEHHISPEG